MTMSLDKNALRTASRAWPAPDPDDALLDAERLAERVEGLEAFGAAHAVMLYWPMSPREIDVTPIARAALTLGKRVCIPRIDWVNRQMDPVALPEWDEAHLERSAKGVPGPNPALPTVNIEEIGLVIVPGIAFDAHCGRLGRGGGFYDRFLVRVGLAAARVGVAFDAQIIAGVPMDRHDTYMDAVVTPTRTFIRE
ncbi:MAG: 5-formyltetrahydrofolate cyclo-ligase [Phycisphaerales bacterium]|jgi:5-formyltetrahydrofolate cyclo-ligase